MSCMAPHRHAQHFDVGVAGLGAVAIQQAAQVQPACRVRVAQRFNRRMEWHVAAVLVCPCAFGDDVFFLAQIAPNFNQHYFSDNVSFQKQHYFYTYVLYYFYYILIYYIISLLN